VQRALDGIPPPMRLPSGSHVAAVIGELFRDASRALARGTALPAATGLELNGLAQLLVRDIARGIHSPLAPHRPDKGDGCMVKHALSVTTIGLALGVQVFRRYGWTDRLGPRRYDGFFYPLTQLAVGLLAHDIGKLAVPSDILQKPDALTPSEWDAMKAHPALGAGMLRGIPGISPLAIAVVESHHERWDGRGYPHNHAAQTIHQFARIAAVADVFDALTSDRNYRRALPVHDASDYIISRSGQDFDPQVIDVFRRWMAGSPLKKKPGLIFATYSAEN
jgi:HD-GYP domain-containing protein (c-di-GMP phosphodiesterase class II)